MQIKKVAQGCRLGNQAEFVPRPHTNTNQQKNSIVENISRSDNWLLDYYVSFSFFMDFFR